MIERAIALLARQQQLIDAQRAQITQLRAERDEARQIRALLVQILDEQRAQTIHMQRFSGVGF
jgi:hypothetical protein